MKRLFVLCVAGALLCLALPKDVRNIGVTISLLCFAIPFAIWVFVLVWRWAGWATKEAFVALQPIPGPEQIFAGLQREWGRPPSAEEISVVQRALINRRNEAGVGAVLSFGALFLISR